ncbi:MAG: ergothioneine biosynthesis glutamate--cysteine ligase EgtA [Acidimicrobiia bacterium]|nr:ergothioneine biosynthesis glutamate--cysteine ligase EgtA [Acidimicrobiia bacterium]
MRAASPGSEWPTDLSATAATDAALTVDGAYLMLQRPAEANHGGPVRVGIEQEWHTYRLTDPGRHLEAAEVLEKATTGGPLPHGSRITVEPGGQVELATLPFDPWWVALEALRLDGAVIRQRLAAEGIATVAAGLDPFRMPSRTLSHPRYVAMEEYFDSRGPAGRRMMASSASIQINIDPGPPEVANQRWGLAHRLGPALGASFACSPSRVFRSARMANWDEIDPTRTRPALRTGDLMDDWASYALGARLMLLHDGPDRCTAVTTPMTFADWIARGIDGRYPTAQDLAVHCTTLFPPVRSRGWLELRWLDSLPAGVAETATAAVSVLLIDEEAGQRASDACASVANGWSEAARQGPRDPALAQAGAACLRIAAEALGRTDVPTQYRRAVAEAAERWPARWRCPADDLEKRLRLGDKVAQLAEPLQEVSW